MGWLRNMKVGNKMFLFIAFSALCLLVVGVTGYKYTTTMSDEAVEMYENQLISIQSVYESRTQARANEALIKELMLTTDQKLKQEIMDEIKERSAKYDKALAEFEKVALDDFEKERLSNIKSILESYRAERAPVIELALANQNAQAYQIFESKAKKYLDESNSILIELAEFNSNAAKEKAELVKAEATNANLIVISFIVAGVLLSIISGVVISRMLTEPIKDMMKLMGKAEKGDITVESEYHSKDEVGILAQSFNQMMKELRGTIGEISDNAGILAASAQQISASTEEIATGIQQQAESSGVVSEMAKEMSYAVQQVAQNAEQASALSEQANHAANNGKKVVSDTVSGMEIISTKMNELAGKSVQIGEIVEVIDEIAEQTNLLALNAAIEAARAGEAGKGFAVVADEVRKLAERSSKATKEIANLIQSIQSNTEAAVNAVQVGNEKVAHAGRSFEEINLVVRDTTIKVAEIAAASEQQAAQSAEVLRAIENIAAVTEQTSSGTEETASTATELSRMAESLNELTRRFKVN